MRQTAPARETVAVESDDAVMARIAGRDALAFSRVVEAQVGLVHRVAYRMLGDAAEAEDVAQEALLRLWASADRWRAGQAGIAAWLTRVAVNLCLDRLRRRRFASDAEVPDRPDGAALADEAMAGEQLRAAALAALGDLSERHRAAIVLTYYEELPNAAAAEVLEMKLKAFESLLLRARGAMRERLAARGLTTLVENGA
ncbi:sigma-70 family RNA polymerase sigma factor [Sphingomonas bacterium]|uniref:sigma-70 family RNA polymerase sigma factor n=1 Tax=Sphingomonas bacterium TaxID=1895847 RepID=UPI0026184B3B|nr:sigma-70 family RNA polymerase sigma factor [Sphingomonas bacterium]MDB5680108.1 polymerase sigma-70 factor, subfamily [Sphingomonas bacterium]